MDDTGREPATFDRVTVDHDTIEQWIVTEGGEPVRRGTDEDHGIDIVFDGTAGAETGIEWQAFFDSFDAEEFVFAYDEDPAGDPADCCALFSRNRIEFSNRVTLSEDEDTTADADPATLETGDVQTSPETEPDQPGDGKSTKRHEAATDQENADNHRDEPPFQS